MKLTASEWDAIRNMAQDFENSNCETLPSEIIEHNAQKSDENAHLSSAFVMGATLCLSLIMYVF